jgi:hypothetical protein
MPISTSLFLSLFLSSFILEADTDIVLTVFLYLIVLLTFFIVLVYLYMGRVLYLVHVRERFELGTSYLVHFLVHFAV